MRDPHRLLCLLSLGLLFLWIFSGVVSAQNKGIFLELGGVAGAASLNYEDSFHQTEKLDFKWRLGLSAFPVDRNNGVIIMVPALAELLVGPKPHKLELGLGQTFSICAGPGMRIAIVGDSAALLEHKYPNPNVEQNTGNVVVFPRDQWTHIEFEALLSQKKKGFVKVWQDDQLIIDQPNWQTLPKDILTFQQGTKGMYSSFEIGLTANPGEEPHTLYVDDVEIGLR